MKRTTTTMLLDQLGCAGGAALSLERVLSRLSGVTRAYVNPVMEVAYVEFDADRCTETDIVRTAQSFGVQAVPSRLPDVHAPPSRGAHH